MRFFKVRSPDGQDGVLAHDPETGRAYSYVPKFKTWHRDPSMDEAPAREQPSGNELASIEAIAPTAAARPLPSLTPTDRRKATDRAIEDAYREQVRQSGEVLTSSEVGLLSRDTRHKMSRLPLLKDLLEVRSAHKRWTWLYLYVEDGSTRRSAVADLRGKLSLAQSSKGWLLDVQHRTRTLTIDGERRCYVVVGCKYIKPVGESAGGVSSGRSSLLMVGGDSGELAIAG